MLTRTFAWRIEAGERETLTVPILDDAGQPFSIAGWTVDCKIRANHRRGATTLYTFPTEGIAVNTTSVTLDIPAAVSASWNWELGWYRLKITDPATVTAGAPNTQRVLQGVFVVDSD